MARKKRQLLEDFENRSVALFARWTRWLRNVGAHPVFAPGLVLQRLPALPALP